MGARHANPAAQLRAFIAALPFFDAHSHVAGFDFGASADDPATFALVQRSDAPATLARS